MSPHSGGPSDAEKPEPIEVAPSSTSSAQAPDHNDEIEDRNNLEGEDGEEGEEEEEEEEEEEPKLKYASLTKSQGAIYRNGDAASSFLVAGDKMIIGTHNGHVHVLSLPSLKPLRSYKAHAASVSMISISPFPPPLPSIKSEPVIRLGADFLESSNKSSPRPDSIKGPRKPQPVPNTPENNIYIASSSIDGNVCVSSLVDPKEVLGRNFGRPVQAVALSPSYRQDRSYISGGRAGQLVLTIGGRAGESATANTTGAAAAAAGWLHNIGLGGNTGTDTVLHSGEGAISTIKWSLSGRYIAWVNETGIKFMRTNLRLESHESEFAWKRMNNITRPKGQLWDDMAGVWAARVEWINEDGLEENEGVQGLSPNPATKDPDERPSSQRAPLDKPINTSRLNKERALIGWGGTIWVVDVHRGGLGTGKDIGEQKIGRPEVVTILKTDCTISGVSQFTPNLILILSYLTPEETAGTKAHDASSKNPKRGISRKQNAIQPEMRIIDIITQEEIFADTLTVSRFESLSATDYHLGVLPVIKDATKLTSQRGALEMIGGVGGSIWDAALYPRKFFSSAASVMSGASTGDSASSKGVASSPAGLDLGPHSSLLTRGMKIFIQSPYDCVLATKLGLSDHLAWLYGRGNYGEAWNLLDEYPEAANVDLEASSLSTPTASHHGSVREAATQGSLAEFFADDILQGARNDPYARNSLAEKEKRQIGDRWIRKLVKNNSWQRAGEVAGKVLTDTSGWERWAWAFADAKRFQELTQYLPVEPLRPPLSSTIYEVFLDHYLHHDLVKFLELLERWPSELYEVASLISAVESELKVGGINEGTTEVQWRLLSDALARLYLADGRARDALKLYIRLKDADAAMSLISSHSLLDAVMDDIAGLVLLRVTKDQRRSALLSDLEEATLEPIRLLVTETCHGLVRPDTVLKKLEAQPNMQPYQFFYLRALWTGDTIGRSELLATPRRSRRDLATDRLATEGKSLVNDVADEALALFADYDRALLFEFLKESQSYTLSKATTVCDRKAFIPEMVYLLAKEGQTKKALRLIIDKLADVSQAIAFAKQQDDADLWNDLLDLSMKKPAFIRALLEEVGTAVDPIALVRRIPEGLEIVGLREALKRMIKEYELQDSIGEGAARVLRTEVADGMACLHSGQKRGVAFYVAIAQSSQSQALKPTRDRHRIDETAIKVGHCCHCGEGLNEYEPEPLIAFPCSHTFHLSCLTIHTNPPPLPPRPQSSATSAAADKDPARLTTFPTLEEPPITAPLVSSDFIPLNPDLPEAMDLSVGPKVRFAKTLRGDRIPLQQCCPLALHAHSNES